MSKRGDGEFWLAFGIVVVLGVGYGVYTVLKSWADTLGLDIPSVFYLALGGVLSAAIALVGVLWADWRKSVVLPWLLPFFGLFCRPALTYWATPHGVFGGAEGYDVEIAWYGNGWWQLAIIAALCGVAFALTKLFDSDRW